MKKVCVLLMLFMTCGCAKSVYVENISKEPIIPIMPGVSAEMQSAGYWIAKADNPDAILMQPEAIALLNAQTAKTHKILTIAEYEDTISGEALSKWINVLLNALIKQELYKSGGGKMNRSDYEEIMSIVTMPKHEINVSFGVIVKNVSQRVIPTDAKLLRKGSSVHFDRNQMNSLEPGDVVAVLWQSNDGDWLYVRSALTVGWVPAKAVARCLKSNIAEWESPENFAVIVRMRAPVYKNPEMTDYWGWLPMGSKIVKTENGYVVPARNLWGDLVAMPVYIEPQYTHEGYLPYTSRNMLNLAFEMLNAPYGWGGMYGEQDCSAYIGKVFSAVGIILPRNSAQQGNSGKLIYAPGSNGISARQAIHFFAIPGATLLQFPGHVMLYVGSDMAEPYVIHAIWAFEELEDGKPALRLPARVVLSNLELSTHSKRGPYHERLTNVRNMIYDDTENANR